MPKTETGIFDKFQPITDMTGDGRVGVDSDTGSSQLSLLKVIAHFVGKDIESQRVESLEQLYRALISNQDEIRVMLKVLNVGRGFSEDASKSILHQLVVRLLELSFSKGI